MHPRMLSQSETDVQRHSAKQALYDVAFQVGYGEPVKIVCAVEHAAYALSGRHPGM